MRQRGGPALRSRALISETTLKADEMSAGCTFIGPPFSYKKGLVFFLLHKQLIKNRFLEKYRLILELKALKFSVKFKYTICILNCKKVKRGDLLEAMFFFKGEQGEQRSRRRQRLLVELHIKLIEPTFSHKYI